MKIAVATLGLGLALAGGYIPSEASARDLMVPEAESEGTYSQDRGGADEFAKWVIAARDNGELPFLIIDKAEATMFVFDPAGLALGAAPVLIGSAVGDGSIVGIGNRELHEIKPAERTTPAGRFVARMGPAIGKYKEVFWVNYADSIALHPVISSSAAERREQRLRSPSPADNRITYGCINVSNDFYRDVVRPLFAESGGIAYILPEERQITDVFPLFEPILAPAPDAVAFEGR